MPYVGFLWYLFIICKKLIILSSHQTGWLTSPYAAYILNPNTYLSLQLANTHNVHILNTNQSIGSLLCNDGKVFETSVLHKTNLTCCGCTEPIYKTLHLVDHHICYQGTDFINMFIYIYIIQKYQWIKSKKFQIWRSFCISVWIVCFDIKPDILGGNNEQQHNIYTLQYNVIKTQIWAILLGKK